MSAFRDVARGRGHYASRRMGPPRRGGGVCPHAASCFVCPKRDCVADGRHYYNEILDANLYLELLGPSEGPQDRPLA